MSIFQWSSKGIELLSIVFYIGHHRWVYLNRTSVTYLLYIFWLKYKLRVKNNPRRILELCISEEFPKDVMRERYMTAVCSLFACLDTRGALNIANISINFSSSYLEHCGCDYTEGHHNSLLVTQTNLQIIMPMDKPYGHRISYLGSNLVLQ